MQIVLHSFEGRWSDSPRPLGEALARSGEHEVLWLADPRHRAGFPQDVATVEWGTTDGRAALEAADLLIANTHTDTEWDKKPGATYLQTWHGTPLKRIHRDVLWAPEGRLDRLDGDVAKWDVLLSPSAAATPWLRQAFRFEGEVLETGYPRNDVLLSPQAPAIRERVRAELGIEPSQRVVLYAPTWRDHEVFEEGGETFGLRLDPAAMADALGPDHVLLLRLHYMLTGRLGTIDHPGVREVSFHPDIAELYLAADVLVTDYSSAMFDFAVTGRPVVLYAYDLEQYRDSTRGFYFDIEAGPPGPVVRTADELLAALQDPPPEVDPAFRERFCHLEDGGATARVLARVLS